MLNNNKETMMAVAWCALAAHAGCQTAPDPVPAEPQPIVEDAQLPKAERPPLERIEPSLAGLDLAALERLEARAVASRSDALVVLKDGKVVLEWYAEGTPPGPIETMSATKSVVSLGLGVLVDEGKITLDQPVHAFFPEWDQGRKKDILVKHLLTHTSGIQADQNTAEIYRSPDFVQLALAAELVTDPGVGFRYNNKAVNLLAGIIERASGQRMDQFIAQALFEPLGIEDHGWTLDKAGNPHAMSGLQLGALDMARLGQLVLDKGRKDDRQIVSAKWIERSLARGAVPSCGLLWWRHVDWRSVTITPDIIDRWKKAGVDPARIEALKPLYDKPLPPKIFGEEVAKLWGVENVQAAFKAEMWSKGVTNGKWEEGPRTYYKADGYLGQYIYIEPHTGLVGVRQMSWRPEYKDASKADSMTDFGELMKALVSE